MSCFIVWLEWRPACLDRCGSLYICAHCCQYRTHLFDLKTLMELCVNHYTWVIVTVHLGISFSVLWQLGNSHTSYVTVLTHIHAHVPLLQATTCMWTPCTPSTSRKWPSWLHPWLQSPWPVACPFTTTETRREETFSQFSPETNWATTRSSGHQRCMLLLAGLWSALTSRPHIPLRSVQEQECTVIVRWWGSYD